MINYVQNIDHPNVHLVIDRPGWHISNYNTLKKNLVKKSSLIQNLEESSSIKKLTCPSIKMLTCPSYEYKSDTQVTFACDDSFFDIWNDYISELKQTLP